MGMRKPNLQSSSNQSGLKTQIRTHPRLSQQVCVKCMRHITVSAVPTQEEIPEEGRQKTYLQTSTCSYLGISHWSFLGVWIYNSIFWISINFPINFLNQWVIESGVNEFCSIWWNPNGIVSFQDILWKEKEVRLIQASFFS